MSKDVSVLLLGLFEDDVVDFGEAQGTFKVAFPSGSQSRRRVVTFRKHSGWISGKSRNVTIQQILVSEKEKERNPF
jgi:hypothetical protein